MDSSASFYILYCINVHCESSVFDKSDKIISHFHVGSLLSARLCPNCHSLLMSAMDIELEQIAAEARVQLTGQATEIERLTRCN
jgi:hypothetical protein